ncbi:secretory calcium-binding phosphoprotein 5 [Genypterus blacodes]|uniref:secretory calcium-binding phosphoprotein 5 n=1 Tax=Genypterus blacodes TaxID=154954 RepID=UPI003F75BFBE
MKLAFLCLCLASAASAAPSFFNYLPHYGASRQQVQQVRNAYAAGQPLPQTGYPAPISMEIIYPGTFPGGAIAGGNPSQGFIKYSIPQPPGRQSVEVIYPFDFSQQRMIPNMPHIPQLPNIFPFDYPPQTVPQQSPNFPAFETNPLPSQDPMQPVLQDQPIQTSQMPAQA